MSSPRRWYCSKRRFCSCTYARMRSRSDVHEKSCVIVSIPRTCSVVSSASMKLLSDSSPRAFCTWVSCALTPRRPSHSVSARTTAWLNCFSLFQSASSGSDSRDSECTGPARSALISSAPASVTRCPSTKRSQDPLRLPRSSSDVPEPSHKISRWLPETRGDSICSVCI